VRQAPGWLEITLLDKDARRRPRGCWPYGPVGRQAPYGPPRIAGECLDWQVSRYGQPPLRGAGLGCIRPSRSTCTLTMFAQLTHRVALGLGTRLGASTGSTNLLPYRGLDRQDRVAGSACAGASNPASSAR
jgi:hypothetical protein